MECFHLSSKHVLDVMKGAIILFSPLTNVIFSVVVIVMDSGQWINLPHPKNGIKPSEHEFAQTNIATDLEEGPTVEEPLHQVL